MPKKVHPIIAPFDVNAVFYPKALANIKKYREYLNLGKKDIKDIDDLIKKWKGKKKNYLFKNSDGRMAYALALYDIKKDKKKGSKKREAEHMVGPLDAKQLKSDNQIMRALELLIGYDLFKGFAKN